MSRCSSSSGRSRRNATSAAPRIWMRNGWMKFMWPTWPIVGLRAFSPVSTRLPPWRLASQVSCSRSRLASNSFSTVTWRIATGPLIPIPFYWTPTGRRLRRFPGTKKLDQILGARGCRELLTKRALRKHLCQLGEELQMLLGRMLGHEQHEKLLDGLAVGRLEGDGRYESDECAGRLRKSFDPSVRNRDPLTEPRRSELFARCKACRDDGPRKAGAALEQRSGLIE